MTRREERVDGKTERNALESGNEPRRKVENDWERENEIRRRNAKRRGSDWRKKRNPGSGRLLQLQLALS